MLPIFDEPAPSSLLNRVNDNKTPIDVEKITNQKKLEVKLYFSRKEKFTKIKLEIISDNR